MRGLRRFGWAAAVLAAAAAPGFGQQGGGPGGGGGGGGGGGNFPSGSATITPSGQAFATNNSPATNNTAGSSGDSGSGPTTEGASLSQFEQAPSINKPSVTQTTSANAGINASNFLKITYGSPYYAGRVNQPAGPTSVNAPGGFGAAVYPLTGTAGGGAGARAGTAGAAGGRGGRGSALTNPSGVVAPSAAIAYPAQVRFAVAPVAPAAVQADLRSVLDQTPTSMLANPAGVQVQVADGNTVVLRGAVRDEDEARLVEGMVRLTPGVRGIKNELTFPKP